MGPNQKPSDGVAVLATLDPASQSAAAYTSTWVSVANFHSFLALISTGVLGTAATVDAKIQQATDSSGTSAKDVTGKAITQIVKASGDNKQAEISFRASDLDTANGFAYAAIVLTVGTAASIVSAYLLGFAPRFEPGSDSNQAGVKQVV